MPLKNFKRGVFFVWLLVFGAINFSAPLRAELSPEVRFDLLKTRLVSAVKADDPKKTLEVISKLRGLKIKLPASVDYFEAKSLLAVGKHDAAHKAAENYINRAGRKGKYYAKVLEIIVAAEDKLAVQVTKRKAIAKARQKKDAADKAEALAKRKALEKNKRKEAARLKAVDEAQKIRKAKDAWEAEAKRIAETVQKKAKLALNLQKYRNLIARIHMRITAGKSVSVTNAKTYLNAFPDGELSEKLRSLQYYLLVKHQRSSQYAKGSTHGLKTSNEYDAAGNLITKIQEHPGFNSKTVNTYDDRGNLKTYWFGIKKVESVRSVNHYNAQGLIVRSDTFQKKPNKIGRSTYTYDDNENIVSIFTRNDDGTEDTYKYKYDAHGNRVFMEYIRGDNFVMIFRDMFDNAGNIIQRTHNLGSKTDTVIKHAYNSVGDKTVSVSTQDKEISNTTYTYDAAGNLLTSKKTTSEYKWSEETFSYMKRTLNFQ